MNPGNARDRWPWATASRASGDRIFLANTLNKFSIFNAEEASVAWPS
jgi:hypothetical protein